MTRIFQMAVSIVILVSLNPVFAVPGDIVSHLRSPGSAPTGIAFDGVNLWVADRLSDTLYAMDPTTGAINKKLPAPGFIPLGLAWDGNSLWCLDGEENRICQLDPATGITTKTLESPTQKPEGLAWDGKYLWLCDGVEDVLCQVSTEDGTTTASFRAPSDASSGIAWWNGYLWCADRRDDKIYLFDPEHGETVFALNSPGKYARGLTTDGKVLWNADYQDRAVYALVMDDSTPTAIANGHILNLRLTYEFRNYGPGDVPSLDVYIAVPSDLENQKLLGEAVFEPEPIGIFNDRWHQPVAHFRLNHPKQAARNRILMTVAANLSDAHTLIYPHKVGSLNEIPVDIREAYLVDEDKYRIHDPLIVNAAKTAIGNETNPYWMMRGIHKHIRENLHYELAGGWNIAPLVLKRGNGSCSEYTFLFISMCRAAGIPARYVGSVVVRGDDASTDDVFHRWSQVFLPGYGWVHVDPQGGDKEKPADVAASIGTVDNRFLITTQSGGASEYLGWGYNYEEKWTGSGPVKVYSEAVGEWSPVVPDSVRTSGTGIPVGAGCKTE